MLLKQRERERERERERDAGRKRLARLLSALAHQMRSASALECVCESSLTTDPPSHYHRNLIPSIHSASSLTCVRACVRSSLTHFVSSIFFPPLSTFSFQDAPFRTSQSLISFRTLLKLRQTYAASNLTSDTHSL